MARKRMLSPTIWEDPSFNHLSVGARLLFIGMISNADDEGYIRGDVGSLKRLIFGFDDTIAHELIKWVEEVGKIKTLHFYEIEGEKYAHFVKWHDYQKQQKDRIQASGYPPCSTCLSPATQMLTKGRLGKVRLGKVKKDIVSADKPRNPEDTQLEKDIGEIIQAFSIVNPTYKKLFCQPPQRQAIKNLLALPEMDKDRLLKGIAMLPDIISQKYAPRITTPVQLENKMGELRAFMQQNKSKNEITIVQ